MPERLNLHGRRRAITHSVQRGGDFSESFRQASSGIIRPQNVDELWCISDDKHTQQSAAIVAMP